MTTWVLGVAALCVWSVVLDSLRVSSRQKTYTISMTLWSRSSNNSLLCLPASTNTYTTSTRHYYNNIITSAEPVMFSVSVCVCVQSISKSYERILMKYSGGGVTYIHWRAPRNNPLDFWGQLVGSRSISRLRGSGLWSDWDILQAFFLNFQFLKTAKKKTWKSSSKVCTLPSVCVWLFQKSSFLRCIGRFS